MQLTLPDRLRQALDQEFRLLIEGRPAPAADGRTFADHSPVLEAAIAEVPRRPSEYMGEMYYTSQPLEYSDLEALAVTLRMINAESQLMYSSDYPHWDFDLPSRIYDLPFLGESAKRNILGQTARQLFGLERETHAPRH